MSFAEIGRFLGGESSDNHAAGTFEGVGIHVDGCAYDGESSESLGPRTEVNGDLPMGYPFVLRVRTHKARDAAPIARGDMIDVATGDAVFDERFRVERGPGRGGATRSRGRGAGVSPRHAPRPDRDQGGLADGRFAWRLDRDRQ